MRRLDPNALWAEQMVQRFAAIALEQSEALDTNDLPLVRRLFWRLEAVEARLKNGAGDERRALCTLFDHPNAQVRLKAAKATLAVAPNEAMQVLRNLAESNEYPQAGEAGMSLWNLKNGVFKPT